MLKYVGEYDIAFSMIILGFLSINMQKEEEKNWNILYKMNYSGNKVNLTKNKQSAAYIYRSWI